MREIMFRAWDKESNKYIYEYQDKQIFEVYGFFSTDRFDYEQYTGLKDNQNRGIYDGDILENINPPGMEDCITSVVWNPIEACWYVENDDIDIYDPIYNVIGYCQVIGNIHETPELLNA